MREILYHPPTRKHTIQCHHPIRKHTIQCHHPIRKHTIQYHTPIRKVVMIIHYKYKATPSVKGTHKHTQHLSILSSLSFLLERNRLRHRSGHGRSPRRPPILIVFAEECHIQSRSVNTIAVIPRFDGVAAILPKPRQSKELAS